MKRARDDSRNGLKKRKKKRSIEGKGKKRTDGKHTNTKKETKRQQAKTTQGDQCVCVCVNV